MDPFNNLNDRHRAMRIMAWSLDLLPIEKLILLYAIQYSDPAAYGAPPAEVLPFTPVRNPAELADFIGASVPDIKAALSSLQAKGFLGVDKMARDVLALTPQFEAMAPAFREREE